MYWNERPGVFRHRPLHSEQPSGFSPEYPSFPIRRPSLFPRRRILINRLPNQGIKPFFPQSTSITDYRPVRRPIMNSRYPAPRSSLNLMSNSMNQPEMTFTHSNSLVNNDVNSISYTSVSQQENFDIDYASSVSANVLQSIEDLWIETTAPNSRVYYYNASSRVSRWDKPDNAKIINLDHIKVLANGPHIRPVQNTNLEPIYNPPSQQSHLRFFPPPIFATGIPPGLFVFPPPNINSPPPFLVRPTSTPNRPDISPFPAATSDSFPDVSGCNSWINEETTYSVEEQQSFICNEAAPMNQPIFENTLQNRQTSNEANQTSERREVAAVEIFENDLDESEIIRQAQEEQAHLIAANEYMDESKSKNSPLSISFPNLKDETQNNDQHCDADSQADTIIKPVDKSRPVSSTPVPGTKWCVVWTGDDKVFFYDADYKTSVWEMPNELKNRSDVQKLVDSPPLITENKQPVMASLSKKIKIEKINITELNREDQSMDSGNTEAIINEAIKKREQLPHETRVQMFLDMLSERNVSAFSTMEGELHKVISDPRYLLLPPKERKQKFTLFLKQKSEEERRVKKKQALEIKNEFKILLQEANVTESTRFVDFVHQHSNDLRFKALNKSNDREVLFSEYVKSLRKKSQDLNDKRKKEFMELLKEQHYINTSTDWLEVKHTLYLDHRYSSISSDYEREKLFIEYIKKQLPHELHSAKEKEDRMNASIKTRRQEVQRELSFHLKELNKERENHKYDAIVNSFKALLVDLVKKTNISWKEAKKILKADHRWTDVHDLKEDKRMKYFDEHINYLIKKKREHFWQILTEIPEITLTSTWKEVKNKVLGDHRCIQFSNDSKKCEREFKEYISNRLKEAKREFKELLEETKIITHTSKDLMKTSNHLENIENALEQDKRYLVLKCVEKERKEILLSYIEKLHRNGPPPPITAT